MNKQRLRVQQGLAWLRVSTLYQFWGLNQNWTPDNTSSHLPKRRHAFCLTLWKTKNPYCNHSIRRLEVAASALVKPVTQMSLQGVCLVSFRLEEHGGAVSGPRQTCQLSLLWRCVRLPTERACLYLCAILLLSKPSRLKFWRPDFCFRQKRFLFNFHGQFLQSMINLNFQEEGWGGRISCFTCKLKLLWTFREAIQPSWLGAPASSFFWFALVCQKYAQSQQPKCGPILSLGMKKIISMSADTY